MGGSQILQWVCAASLVPRTFGSIMPLQYVLAMLTGLEKKRSCAKNL